MCRLQTSILVVRSKMRRLLLLTVLGVISISCMAIALRKTPAYYPAPPFPHDYLNEDAKNEDATEYYKPTISENYDVHKSKPDSTLNNYPDISNKNYNLRDTTVGPQLTPRPPIVEQYLKEVAPTTKTAYSPLSQIYRNGKKIRNAGIPYVSSSYEYQMFQSNPKSRVVSQDQSYGYQVEEPTTPQPHTIPFIKRPKVSENKLGQPAQLSRSLKQPVQNVETSAQNLKPAFSDEYLKYYLQLPYDYQEQPTAQKPVEIGPGGIQRKAKTTNKYLPVEEDQGDGPGDGVQYEIGSSRAIARANPQPFHRFKMPVVFRYQNIPVFDRSARMKVYYPQPPFQTTGPQKPFKELETEDSSPPTRKPYQVRPAEQIMKRIPYYNPVQTADPPKPFQEEETEENYPVARSYRRPVAQHTKLIHYNEEIPPRGLSRDPEDPRNSFQEIEREENYPRTGKAYQTDQPAYKTAHYPKEIETAQKQLQGEPEENYPQQFAAVRKAYKPRPPQRSESIIAMDKSGYYLNESPRSSIRTKQNFVDYRKAQPEIVRQDVKVPPRAQEISRRSQNLAFEPYQPETEVALENPLESQRKSLRSFNAQPIYFQSNRFQRNKVPTQRGETSERNRQQESLKLRQLEHQVRYFVDYGDSGELLERFQE